MGGSYWLLVLVGVASLLSIIHGQASCPKDGAPGMKGEPGRDGLTGSKGQKGEQAEMEEKAVDPLTLLRLKGDAGPRGAQGAMGPKGYSGHLGEAGTPGLPGAPGPQGIRSGQSVDAPQKHSAFSVIRTNVGYPRYGEVVTFDNAVVNDPGHFNMRTGEFTCATPGVYYFNFHSFTKVSMCLSISTGTDKYIFCDYNNRNYDQVLSGGVVLKLIAEQKVWLESVNDRHGESDVRDKRPKQIIFNGFLIF